MDRTLTRILLARSNAESSTPGDSDNHDVDGFCRWSTPEVGTLRASSTECESATRELVETTRPAACRHNSNPVGPMSLSYNDLIEGGCVSRRTFCYVPDNGAYASFKTAVRVNRGKQRRQYGLGRRGMTKSVQGGDGGGSTSWQSSCNDRLNTLTPGQDVQQKCSDRTNQTACNDKQQVMGDSQSHQSEGISGNKGSRLRLPRGRRNNETMVTCSGDEVRTRQDQPRSDSRLIKTWLYAFLPPLVTTQLDHGDADPLRGKLTDARDHGFPASKSRAASGRSGDRRSSDEQHPTVASRMVPTRLEDQAATANRRQRKPRSTASDDAVDSHGERGTQTVDLDRRSGRRCLDMPSDDCHVHFTETSLLPRCDSPHHQEDDSDHDDTTELTTTSRSGEDQDGEREYQSNDDNSDDDDDDDDDDDRDYNDDKENEAVKSALKSFSSRLNELETLQTREQLQLSLTGHVVDIHRRHQESCKS